MSGELRVESLELGTAWDSSCVSFSITSSLSGVFTSKSTWDSLGQENAPSVMVADGVGGLYLRNAETINLESHASFAC